MARSLFNPKMKRFCVLGVGLGYLPWQMYEYSNSVADVYIYETDKKLVEYAMDFGTLYKIPKDKLHIVCDADVNCLLEKYVEHFDSYKECETVLYAEDYFVNRLSDKTKALVEKIKNMVQTEKNFGLIKEQNYYLNHLGVKKKISDIAWEKASNE